MHKPRSLADVGFAFMSDRIADIPDRQLRARHIANGRDW
jgi:hypothetical protein